MREMETQDQQPLGGLQADTMGFGKTVMIIAAMIANQPTDQDSKCTLIVCPSALVTQWNREIAAHTEPNVFKSIMCYHSSHASRTFRANCESTIANADVVITTYQEVLKSYPNFKPPKEIILPEEREEWWKKTWEQASFWTWLFSFDID